MSKQYVFLFEENKASPETIMLLGNKGAQLAEMSAIGLPVPPGFTISTEACNEFYELGKKWPDKLQEQVKEKLEAVEKKMGKKFGDKEDPLLFSVRSGSYVSMPGMMDTVLNLGLNDETVLGLAKKTGNERGAWDSYRRFIQMFGDVVMEVKHEKFEKKIHAMKQAKGVKFDTDLTTEDLKELVKQYKEVVKQTAGKDFPTKAEEQLTMGINAVFNSWNCPRALKYRKINHLDDSAGTGVNVQVMVFGNMGDDCATGVGFTRNPSTGEKEHYGEYLINAQGEDVVAGIRTPKHIDDMKKDLPKSYKEIVEIYDKLEKHYKEMQDFEFTIQSGKLFILQTRNGKRTAQAGVKIAVDMKNEGLIDEKEAVMRVKPEQLDQLLHKQLDQVAKDEGKVIATGLPASPGAAVGTAVFTADAAAEKAESDEKVILVRTETSPEDIEGMNAAQGILTARGGMTSHAAVVARGMGKCCVAGCGDITVDEEKKQFVTKDGITIKEGDEITLDGGVGDVYEGKLRVVDPELAGDFAVLMEWADKFRKIEVKTNADTPEDAEKAKGFGAQGIGLTRTEHMFFHEDRISVVREMILAKDLEGRKKALDKLLPFQKEDFKGLFKAMDGLPVIIRLLDPPLHEFLPRDDKEIKKIAKELNITETQLKETIESLHEFNPMLGFRGCRLGVTYPEINEMQARAIFQAALELASEGGKPMPEIEVPLIGNVKEFVMIKEIIQNVAKELNVEGKVEYKIGTMIEVPRAALTADEIAEEADFLSFGTNDLTQMGCGFSRDDAAKFLGPYVDKKIYDRDPFQAIDQQGIGKLMEICVEKARSVKPNIPIGICGEHGGEPTSVEFCHRIGLNDVSCSPFRVPIAKLAAAQAAIKEKE